MGRLSATFRVVPACLEMRNIFLGRQGALDNFVLFSFTNAINSSRRQRWTCFCAPMDLLLRSKGASPEEVSRGIAAAEAVLERAGITAEEAAEGMFGALNYHPFYNRTPDVKPSRPD